MLTLSVTYRCQNYTDLRYLQYLESDHGELQGHHLLHVDSLGGQTGELSADLRGRAGGIEQTLQLIAGHDLDHGTEDGAVLHLLVEQGAELLLGQDGDDLIQKCAQASGSVPGYG